MHGNRINISSLHSAQRTAQDTSVFTLSLQAWGDNAKGPGLGQRPCGRAAGHSGGAPVSTLTVHSWTLRVPEKSGFPSEETGAPWPRCTADRWPWWPLGGGSADGLEEGSWRRRAEDTPAARGAGGRFQNTHSATIAHRGHQPDAAARTDCQLPAAAEGFRVNRPRQ